MARPIRKELIPLFYPHIPERAGEMVQEVLSTRWVGQAHRVDAFEKEFGILHGFDYCVAVNSGTAALHLACILADIKPGDEVLTPVLTCTATNMPLLWMGAKIVFVDVRADDLNMNMKDALRKVTDKTKAIVTVDFGGNPCDYDHLNSGLRKMGRGDIKVIRDGAQMVGGFTKSTDADYSCFSFQAIKNITTGDGGMLCVRDEETAEKARRLRWFGIDRKKKAKAGWQAWQGRAVTTPVSEVGYKYQMNDIAAAIGLAGLQELNSVIRHRRLLVEAYDKNLRGLAPLVWREGAAYWLMQVLVEERDKFAAHLLKNGVETNVTHIRNDIFEVFGGKRQDLPTMNALEAHYICLPLNTKVSGEDVMYICEIIREGW